MCEPPSHQALIRKLRELEDRLENLQKTEKALKSTYEIINRSPAVVFLWRDAPGWPVVLVSENVETIFGYSPSDFRDDHLSYAAIIHPDDIERVSAEVATHSADPLSHEFFHQPYRLITTSGETRWVEDRTVIGRDADGTITHYEGIVIDITDCCNAQQALVQSQQEWETTFAAMADWVCLVDLRRRILRTNAAGETFTGVAVDDLRGRTCCELLHTAACAIDNCPMERMLETGRRENGDFFNPEKQRWLRVTVDPVTDGNGHVMSAVHIVRDITDMKKVEQERLKAEKLKTVGILAGGIAHDFNNLLSVILGNLELAAHCGTVAPEIASHLKKAETAAGQARELTRNLMLFARGSAPAKRQCDLRELIAKIVAHGVADNNLRCELELPDDLWSSEIDPEQMQLALANLLSNAREAMPAGGTVTVAARNVHLETPAISSGIRLAPGRFVRIDVRDQGTGIAPHVLPHIFDPYFSTKSKGVQKGMGLGLAITSSIVEKHGGHIGIDTRENGGTTFSVYLPARRAKAPAAGAAAVVPSTAGRAQRILVMDDEPMILDLCRQMLEMQGYRIEMAEDGPTAVDKYRDAMRVQDPFHAVILDLAVKGGIGGLQVIAKLVEIDPDVKAIVCSGYSDDPVMTDCTRYGFAAALTKPYTREGLVAAVASVLKANRP